MGTASQLEVTLDQMILACQAVRRGVTRALVSCDVPFGPLQEGPDAAVRAAIRLVKEGGADLVKLDARGGVSRGGPRHTRAGIPVWAQFGITPHTALQYGGMDAAGTRDRRGDEGSADRRGQAPGGGRCLAPRFHQLRPGRGPRGRPRGRIPVIGGLGGGPWLDGRVRSVVAAIGYLAAAVDDTTPRYANVAEIALDAIKAFSEDVRAGRQIKG